MTAVIKLKSPKVQMRIMTLKFVTVTPGGGGGGKVGRYSLIWAIQGRAAGQGMVFWPRSPKQGVQFALPLS